MQRYNFIYTKYVLYKIIFMYAIYIISNSYKFYTAKTRQADSKNHQIFRTILEKSAKNRTPATLRQRAFSGNKLKIKQL